MAGLPNPAYIMELEENIEDSTKPSCGAAGAPSRSLGPMTTRPLPQPPRHHEGHHTCRALRMAGLVRIHRPDNERMVQPPEAPEEPC